MVENLSGVMTRQYKSYETICTVSLQEVIPFLYKKEFLDLSYISKALCKIPLIEPRLLVFAQSITCYSCGMFGTFFAVQRNRMAPKPYNKWHLNLYSSDGHQMTCDHLIPRSHGGTDDKNNLACMCYKCNQQKSSKDIGDFLLSLAIKIGA